MPQNQGARRINEVLNRYWERVASKYYVPDIFGRRIIETFIKKLGPFKSLVEVGCGTGELFSIYKDIPAVIGLDWQLGMLRRSKGRVERHGYNNIKLEQLDITQNALPQKFDVALTRTVLMHIDPCDVEAACRNMTLMSDLVVCMEYYSPLHDKLADTNWHHEYREIFKALGYRTSEVYQRPDDVNQTLFVFRRADTQNGEQSLPYSP